ncbi:MAG: hypothetical protein IT557_02755 [Alphaproteobacteria bacterium]|nr:hypothetical protein [Alphaproteobacteria bacterium]
MTPDRPDAAELLAIARTTLMTEIVPALSGEQRLAGLMIANALGLAGREVAARMPPDESAVAAEDRAVVNSIRAGVLDHAIDIHDRLLRDAEARVAIANPKYR